MRTILFTAIFVFAINLFSQDTLRITDYNLLNFSENTYSDRVDDFRVIIHSIKPDIIACQEMVNQAGVDMFLNQVLNYYQDDLYQAAQFVNGYDTDNALFYRADKFSLISNRQIGTELRDISEYKLTYLNDANQKEFYVYSCHLKASTGTDNKNKRLAEAIILRNELNLFPEGTNFVLCGDLNVYTGTEPAFELLIEEQAGNDGQLHDPINRIGSWHDKTSYADIHTQSTHKLAGGGYSYGGLDDRFDFILISSALMAEGDYQYLTDTYQAYGNDGQQFNESLNHVMPNLLVPDSVVYALIEASDHLPVVMDFVFAGTTVPVELVNFNAYVSGNMASLNWETVSESNNSGFSVERSSGSQAWQQIGFIPGNGTCSVVHRYNYTDKNLQPGKHDYRLKQIDFDGQFEYSKSIQVNIDVARSFSLGNAYPNPFNSITSLSFQLPEKSDIRLTVYNVQGHEVETIATGFFEPGVHHVKFNASELVSGVYFVRMTGNDFVFVKKVILLK